MKVSVVICTYSEDLYDELCDAIESIRRQTYDDVEVVVVVDGDENLYDRAISDWGDIQEIKLYCNDENMGLSASRNRGIELAGGDVVAFMDDDAIADDQWLEELVSIYEDHSVEAVGGKMTPIWVAGKPSFLPAEFYWLVGVTHKGFPDAGPVRNTFGSNISFRTDVLDELGGFDTQLGRKGEKHVQGEETELAARLRAELDGTLYYTPAAQVGHKIFEERTRPHWLVKRAFWQGYSKRIMSRLLPESGDDEAAFLKRLAVESIPERTVKTVRSPSFSSVLQILAIFLFTIAVGTGYAYAVFRENFPGTK